MKIRTFVFIILFLFQTFIVYALEDNTVSIPVLCYHHVRADLQDSMNTPPDVFEKQMAYLKEMGYTSITSDEIKFVRQRGIKKPIIISFDDGNRSVYQTAFPIMNKYGFKGVVFLISVCVREKPSTRLLAIDEIRALYDAGWEIGSHTYDHQMLNKISEDPIKLDEQIVKAKLRLEKVLGIKINSIAYPYGIITKPALDLVKENYTFGYTINEGDNSIRDSNFMLKRYMLSYPTSMTNFKLKLNTRDAKMSIVGILDSIETCSISIKSDYQNIKNLKINFNFKTIKDYKIENGIIIFSAPVKKLNNQLVVRFDDAGVDYVCSKVGYVEGGTVVFI